MVISVPGPPLMAQSRNKLRRETLGRPGDHPPKSLTLAAGTSMVTRRTGLGDKTKRATRLEQGRADIIIRLDEAR